MELTAETLTKIDEVVARYPDKRSSSLMVIHLIQDELGAISDEACEWIAEKLELQPINIKELITFYPMLRETPWGKTHVRVCRTLPCALRGSYVTCQTLEKKLGVKEGHVRNDGEYSLEFMECLADCGEDPWSWWMRIPTRTSMRNKPGNWPTCCSRANWKVPKIS